MDTLTPLDIALNRYKTALNLLGITDIIIADGILTEEKILSILTARDEVEKQLKSVEEIPVNVWSKLVEQDNRLKENAYKITEVFDWESYRESFSISEQAWWWYLDSRESQHPCNRYDWVFKLLKLLLLGVNFSLIATISTRFLAGGSGWLEIGLIVFSTFISLLQTENALTKGREKIFIKLMKLLTIREHLYEEIQLLTTFIFFIILLTVQFNSSRISDCYKRQGEALQSPKIVKNYLNWTQQKENI